MKKAILPIILFTFFISCKSQNIPPSIVFKETIIKNGSNEGTLSSSDTKTPLVIIVPGSGPTDRNGNGAAQVLNTNAYKMISDELAKRDIATFRFDKQGVGASIYPGFDEGKLTFDTYIEDLVQWIQKLKDQGFEKIYLIGHSEGSLISMVALQKNQVSGFISLSGPYQPADEVLIRQLKGQPLFVISESNAIISELKAGRIVNIVPSYLQILFRTSVQPYLISWFKYSPTKEIRKVACKTLIIQGTTDIQIPEYEADSLHKYKPEAEMLKIDQMNHILKTSSMIQNENVATYSNPKLPLAPSLIDKIESFVKK